MEKNKQIEKGFTSIGIEFGSTRIKAILIGNDFSVLAGGTYNWNNKLENGIWTYSLSDIHNGLSTCFSNLMKNVYEKYGTVLKTTSSIGISAMMHGYLVFDSNNKLLVPFRTWRNTITYEASKKLSEIFDFNIPQRWSIAHLYQAILNNEKHIRDIKFITTLAGYVHFRLTGKKVIGIGDGSGMFPISSNGSYNTEMMMKFDNITKGTMFSEKIGNILPVIIPAGEEAGKLTENGAKLLDTSGLFSVGVPFCAPEGDAQTGMVATNSIAVKTGSISAGTSIFGMFVLEKELSKRYEIIDIVTTPCGNPVAMVHCNNCSTDLDCYVELFGNVIELFGFKVSKSRLYEKLYEAALTAFGDIGGIINCNYHSGEHITNFTEGRPFLLRTPNSQLTVNNLMRCLIYSTMSTLKLGINVLIKYEKIKVDRVYAHGGLFKIPIATQKYLAAALETPVEIMNLAGEGGAWGTAILAAFEQQSNIERNLVDFLQSKVFAKVKSSLVIPSLEDIELFSEYVKKFEKILAIEAVAINTI